MTDSNRPGRRAARHLDTATTLDFLEGRLAPARRRAIEEHLGGPCPECHARLREVGRLLDHMRLDRTPEVPEALRRAALAAFPAHPAETPAPSLAARVARLLFDSLAAPAPAAARRAVGEARRLRYAIGDLTLELETELVARGAVALRGRLSGDEAALHAIDVSAGGGRFRAWPDADGAFGFDRLPPGPVEIAVTGPGGTFRLPPFAS